MLHIWPGVYILPSAILLYTTLHESHFITYMTWGYGLQGMYSICCMWWMNHRWYTSGPGCTFRRMTMPKWRRYGPDPWHWNFSGLLSVCVCVRVYVCACVFGGGGWFGFPPLSLRKEALLGCRMYKAPAYNVLDLLAGTRRWSEKPVVAVQGTRVFCFNQCIRGMVILHLQGGREALLVWQEPVLASLCGPWTSMYCLWNCSGKVANLLDLSNLSQKLLCHVILKLWSCQVCYI